MTSLLKTTLSVSQKDQVNIRIRLTQETRITDDIINPIVSLHLCGPPSVENDGPQSQPPFHWLHVHSNRGHMTMLSLEGFRRVGHANWRKLD